jgi:hypothetical protein
MIRTRLGLMAVVLALIPLGSFGANQYKGTVSDSSSAAKIDSVKILVKRATNVVCSTYTGSQGQFFLSCISGVIAPVAYFGNKPFALGFDEGSKTISWSGKHAVALALYSMQGARVAASQQLTGEQSYRLPRLPNGVYILKTSIDGHVWRGKLMLAGNASAAIDMAGEGRLDRAGKVLSAPDTLLFSKWHYITKKMLMTASDTSLVVKLVSVNTLPPLRLFSPNGGQTYRIGDSIVITYQVNPDSLTKVYPSLLVGPYSYDLVCDSCYESGTTGFPANGGQVTTFVWQIRDTIFYPSSGLWRPMPTSTTCKIKITDYNLKWMDQSDSSFAILPKQ